MTVNEEIIFNLSRAIQQEKLELPRTSISLQTQGLDANRFHYLRIFFTCNSIYTGEHLCDVKLLDVTIVNSLSIFFVKSSRFYKYENKVYI